MDTLNYNKKFSQKEKHLKAWRSEPRNVHRQLFFSWKLKNRVFHYRKEYPPKKNIIFKTGADIYTKRIIHTENKWINKCILGDFENGYYEKSGNKKKKLKIIPHENEKTTRN